uniref:Hemolysin-type calcium-binding repeat-containing protein n=1 Tax=Candidatus Kentrum sp. DK TaxID=2126562 RepID=A0A450SPV0_9GAMM|nr:MAG: hypothetical protein BECKDK2373B_GA0170837_105523 [Candidatus Kentron sp. DK]
MGDNGYAQRLNGGVYEIASIGFEAVDGDVHYERDTIQTGDGGDILIGGNGADRLDGGAGDDLILGDNARLDMNHGDVVGLIDHGHPGNAYGNTHHDGWFDHHGNHLQPFEIRGLNVLADGIGGDDTLKGGAGDDLIYGQHGNDTYAYIGGGLGHDYLIESVGSDGRTADLHDRLDFSGFIGAVDIDLGGGSDGHSDGGSDGDDHYYHGNHARTINDGVTDGALNLELHFNGDAFEDVTGGAYDDKIHGNWRNNTLIGGGGDDELKGEGGDDVLLGFAGSDTLDGGTGLDILDGGDGDDQLKVANDHKNDPEGDVLLGGAGDDDIRGGKQAALLVGGAGDDHIRANGKTLARIIQDDGAGLPGLQNFFGSLVANTDRDDTFIVDPSTLGADFGTGGNTVRAWLDAFLTGLPGASGAATQQSIQLQATAAPEATLTGVSGIAAPEGSTLLPEDDASFQGSELLDETRTLYFHEASGELASYHDVDAGQSAQQTDAKDDDGKAKGEKKAKDKDKDKDKDKGKDDGKAKGKGKAKDFAFLDGELELIGEGEEGYGMIAWV